MSIGINNSLVSNFFLVVVAVPKWILEGRCNMGLLLPGATKHKEERKKRPIIKQIGKNNDSRLGLCSAGSN